MGLSLSHLIVLLLVVLIVFGAGRLPKVMGDIAKGIKMFRNEMKNDEDEDKPSLSDKTNNDSNKSA
jgi:sec-independent protein translocase protein TatA